MDNYNDDTEWMSESIDTTEDLSDIEEYTGAKNND